ncbi:2-isopropylmalate synthase [Nonomuraea sp. FMUSA5-5]|uniref:2-isopropylmalate synthase n=1 Tax=Nonomuraea composti TaxID=2720023 RepID=A0ABX1BI84_9ACTN|nr:2-isopropylmalate synthase [Nonomuraea sp. FMUSA5-5]
MVTSSSAARIYDWNTVPDAAAPACGGRLVELNDETLRDGLQSPSARQPDLAERMRLLQLMDRLGIDAASIGMPASGAVAGRMAAELAAYGARQTPRLRLHCAARTAVSDIQAVADVSQAAGRSLDVTAFIGSSHMRMGAEGWTVAQAERIVRKAVRFAVAEGLPVCLAAEDGTRARPRLLRRLCLAALDEGAVRICLCDTAGHADPRGTAALIRHVREQIMDPAGYAHVPIDWHGHNDRGLALANALAAVEAGASRVHATALGIGERCGNTAMDQLLVNLNLLGDGRDLDVLGEYCRTASAAVGRPIPPEYPVFGRDAFFTATGVHAAAVAKAERAGDPWLADLVYSGVPASRFGRRQEIGVGPASGRWNVQTWLRRRGLPSDPLVIDRILTAARSATHVLTDHELASLAAD